MHHKITEPRMLQSFMSTDAQLRSQLKHALQQVNTSWVNGVKDVAQILCGIHLKCRFVFRKLSDPRPSTFSRSPHDPKYANNLVFVRGSRKQRSSGIHFSHDTASRPNVNARIVCSTAEKNIRGTIPESHNFIGKSIDGNPKSTSKAKIAKFQDAFVIDEKILRFQVSVEDSILMAEIYTLEKLVHERFDRGRLQSPTFSMGIHVSFQVTVHELEYQHELILGMNHIMQGYNILMLQFLHQGDFSNSC